MRFASPVSATCALLCAAEVVATPSQVLDERHTTALGTATVELASPSGSPNHLASGFIYGIPDTPNQIPAEFYTGMAFGYGRAGGAQISAPGRGWIWGPSEYNVRFNSALSNYRTCREHGAKFQLLLHDMWGADGTENATALFPGDDGDWTSYDEFLTYVIANMTSSTMTDGLDIDIWNEPDGTYFWKRTESQYLQMWGRGYARLRKTFGEKVLLVGPSFADQPTTSNPWWTGYLSFIGSNNSVPDQYTWHIEGNTSSPNDDPQVNQATLRSLLQTYSLPTKPFNVNEYGVPSEQQPGGAAWWISRLERNNLRGLRGNWNSAGALHDYLASLLGKPGAGTASYSPTSAGYWPNGEWQVYRYYAQDMTGMRVATTSSQDNLFDAYATSTGAPNGVKILCGPRVATGTWDVTVTGFSAVGRPKRGMVKILTRQFSYTGGVYGDVASSPVNLGVKAYPYSGDSLTFGVTPADNQTAYAFEFV